MALTGLEAERTVKGWQAKSSTFAEFSNVEAAARAPGNLLQEFKQRFVPKSPVVAVRASVSREFDSERWIAAGRQGALLHLSRTDAKGPVCSWRQRLQAGVFRGGSVSFQSFQDALLSGRKFCPSCKKMLPVDLQQQLP